MTELRGVNMRSHNVTCYPTHADIPSWTPANTWFTYPGGMEGWVGL